MRDITMEQPEKPRRRNPGGRPETSLRALARDYSAQALARLAVLMDDPNPCVALGATRMMLERGHGKEPLEHTGKRVRIKPQAGKLNVRIMHFGEQEKRDA